MTDTFTEIQPSSVHAGSHSSSRIIGLKEGITKWRRIFRLDHWQMGVSSLLPTDGHAMEVAHNRLRQEAAFRARGEFVVEKDVIHEMLHVVMDRTLEEYQRQVKRLPTDLQEEYLERYKMEHEKAVEHLAKVIYSL